MGTFRTSTPVNSSGPQRSCDLAPELWETAARRVAAPDQDLQLAHEHRRTRARPVPGGPGRKTSLGQTLRAEPVPTAVVVENAQHVAPLVAEHEERTVHRLSFQHDAGHRRGSLDAA